jgi:hypothetical protein
MMKRRRPAWACPEYDNHGEEAVCGDCIAKFRAQGSKTRGLIADSECRKCLAVIGRAQRQN